MTTKPEEEIVTLEKIEQQAEAHPELDFYFSQGRLCVQPVRCGYV